MYKKIIDGISIYQFEELQARGVTHALITRNGGVSRPPFATLNLGHTVGDDLNAVEENHRRALRALGLHRSQVVSPYQVHGTAVRWVGQGHTGTVQPATDGLMTATPGVGLLLRFADCVPVLLFDPVHRAAGLVHAGWRGAVAGVVRSALEALVRNVGSNPGDLWAGIGPAIGPCCYEVGREVEAAVRAQSAYPEGADLLQRRDGALYLDLPGLVRAQLRAGGVGKVTMPRLCTACHTEEWFSHRGENGRTGRFGALMMLNDGGTK